MPATYDDDVEIVFSSLAHARERSGRRGGG
jgi:hypothetical protein